MALPTRYCSHCGKPLNAGARFCGSCGQPVQPDQPAQPVQPVKPAQPVQPAPPPAAPAAPTPPAEQVLGVIPGGSRKKGFMGMSADMFTLVVTNYRVIFALQTKEMQQEDARLAKEAAKQQGKGFFGQWGAVITSGSGQKYQAMAPQAIMVEQPGNFYVDYNQVRSVRVREYSDDESSRTDYHLVFETATGKIDILFFSFNEKQVKALLSPMLGSRIK